MWPFRTIALERELRFMQMELRAEQNMTAKLLADRRAATRAKHRTTDLPDYRAADLAGYLGRVNELLSFAAMLIPAPLEAGPHADAIAARFRDAAAKAQMVQSDLLAIVEEMRVKAENDAASS